MKFRYWTSVNLGAPPITQRADCVLRSIAYLCGMDYCDADAFLSAHGRDRGRGVSSYQLIKDCGYEINGYKFKKIECKGFPLWLFVSGHMEGNYLLRIKGHVFVLSDGVVIDYAKRPGVLLDWAMKVEAPANQLKLEDLI